MASHSPPILKKKIHTDRIQDILVSGASDHGVHYKVFSNVECRDVTIADSKDGFRFHNSDREPAIDVDGRRYNLVLNRCDTVSVGGDGLYVTKVDGALIENCKFAPPTESAGDCCQIAFERSEQNISRNVEFHGCVMLQADTGSHKGALILERTVGYSVDACWFGGINFSMSSAGSRCVVRNSRFGDAMMNGYSFGYGVSGPHDLSDHHVYDNLITRCRRGISLSSFGDRAIKSDGITGYQRSNMVIHDNIVSDCEIGFFADRAWSGAIYRNIFLRCDQASVVRGLGLQVAAKRDGGHQIMGPIYTNDGSFRCEEAATLHLDKDVLKVSPAKWSHAPDDLRYIWRTDGIDVPTGNVPVFHPVAGQDVSCVVLARKGKNWMLSVAEQPWAEAARASGRAIPRAVAEGFIDWGSRYVRGRG